MNPGPTEEVAKVATSFIDSMKQQPLSLALVLMNICLLGFFYVILAAIASQREREIGLLYEDNRAVRELLSKCGATKQGAITDPLPPFKQLTAEEPPRRIATDEPPRPPMTDEPPRPPMTDEPPRLLLPLPSKGWPK